jgi:hypothetical protein
VNKIHKWRGVLKVNPFLYGESEIKTPLCAGAKGLWKGKAYLVHRNWKYVTCKKCLAQKQD